MGKKKILIINTKYREFGGEDSNILDEINFLEKYFEVDYLAYDNNEKLKIIDYVSFFTLNNKKSNSLFLEKIKKFNPDLVYVNNTWFKANLGIFDILKDLNIKTILKIHNFRYDCTRHIFSKKHFNNQPYCKKCGAKSKKFQIINKYFSDSYLKSLAVLIYGQKYFKILKTYPITIFTLNSFHKDMLVRAGVNEKKIMTYYNPIINNIIQNSPDFSNKDEVIYAGRLSEEKGVKELLESWTKANTKDLVLKIIGIGELYDYLKHKYSSNNIIFTGFNNQSETLKIIRNSRAVITTTKIYEGQPRLLCEASSFGVPSIFPKFGGVNEYYPNDYIFSFEQYDYNDLNKKIELLHDDELVATEGQRAYKFLNELIREEEMINTFEKLIEH